MHEKLIKQLRTSEHCNECPYNKDCDDFDSCLMELLAADAIEDMSKRIARLEKEAREKERCIDNYIEEVNFTRKFIHEHGLEFALASAWDKHIKTKF